jgi:hypothetical protein
MFAPFQQTTGKSGPNSNTALRQHLDGGLKAENRDLPGGGRRGVGLARYGTGRRVGNGIAMLARGEKPIETRRGLPREAEDTHSRYLRLDEPWRRWRWSSSALP